MDRIASRRALLKNSSSEDDDSDRNSDDDNLFSTGSTPPRRKRKSNRSTYTNSTPTPARRTSTTRQKRQSMHGSAPLDHLTESHTPKADVVKYRRGSVLSNVAPPSAPTLHNNDTDSAARSEVDTYDLTQLPDPTHHNILEILAKRWHDGLIYTSVGDCLISVNPYRWIESLYNPKIIEGCLAVSKGAEHFPHVYQIANDAYHALKTTGTAQSIVIAGESGSGKTENMKKCLQFFTRIALGEDVLIAQGGKGGGKDDDDDTQTGPPGGKQGAHSLERRILAMNPLLEALGNATTSRNDNSSRFGRWIEISFDHAVASSSSSSSSSDVLGGTPTVVGCTCQSYLLEKSRVTQQQPGDRNFHIFYMLLSGASTDLKRTLSLNEPSFHYINGGTSSSPSSPTTTPTTHTTVDDAERYKEFLTAATNVGLTTLEVDSMLVSVASCLHLGNVTFDAIDQSSCRVHSKDGGAERALQVASAMLGVNPSDLETSLCYRTIQMRSSGEEMQVPMGIDKATSARDALSKALYSKLFVWLVARLNQTLLIEPDVARSGGGGGRASVGILDIFGFEIMNLNEFEQLCINYVNEKLQHFFNKYTFDEEIALYAREGIALKPVEFSQNASVIQLFEKRYRPVVRDYCLFCVRDCCLSRDC